VIARGDVFVASFGAGRRPGVVVTRDVTIATRSRVTMAPITRRVRGLDTEVPVGASEGLPSESVINCDNLETLDTSRLVRRLGQLGPQQRRALDDALRIALELD
jgi:mRNA interferase MazF